jgi:hypothetical protein
MMNMNDRELLELAAKAGEIGPVLCYESKRNCLRIGNRESYRLWRPLGDDGDNFRLMIKLHIQPDFSSDHLRTTHYPNGAWYQPGQVVVSDEISYEDDRYAATRRAIVLAAAEIGKSLP